ncbi:hypothetical protein [Arthrobacter sp. NPDC089319]|uniref:hypothetical protein n=1 Tax=Arthrobacter sp. NPDC089319 TaxID=3155915 RepID=UPI0034436E2F
MEEGPGTSGSGSRVPTVVQAAACLLALAASAAALFLPTVVQETVSGSPGAEPERSIETLTLLQASPGTILIPLAVPPLLTLLPLLVPRRAAWLAGIICCALLFGFIALATATVGWFYLPALAAAVVAVFLRNAARAARNPKAG